MQFDIDKFFDNLQDQALSKQEASKRVHKEIRDAEKQKIAFVDQSVDNPVYFKFITNQIDIYITYLKVLHNRIIPEDREEIGKQTYDTDKAVEYHTMKLMMQLEQLEARKFARAGSTSKGINPYISDTTFKRPEQNNPLS